MRTFNPLTAARLSLLLVIGVLTAGLAWPLASLAQNRTPDPAKQKHADKAAAADQDLTAQVHDLQAKIAKLEAALKQGHKGTPSGAAAAGGMSGMPTGKGMMGMGGMEGMNPDEMMKMMSMMGGMQGKTTGGMAGMAGKGMEDDDMDMMATMGMGNMAPGTKGMKGMGKMQKTAALHGFPGASHIYHTGATGFFLDHPDHLKLTTKQQTTLNSLKEKALLEKSTSQRKIDEAEQDLWTLSACDNSLPGSRRNTLGYSTPTARTPWN
jgi:hypothetical protein